MDCGWATKTIRNNSIRTDSYHSFQSNRIWSYQKQLFIAIVSFCFINWKIPNSSDSSFLLVESAILCFSELEWIRNGIDLISDNLFKESNAIVGSSWTITQFVFISTDNCSFRLEISERPRALYAVNERQTVTSTTFLVHQNVSKWTIECVFVLDSWWLRFVTARKSTAC